MIKFEHVNKRFDDILALDDFNLHAPKGCVYGLVGPNGAGKSTALRVLTGVYRQDSGAVLVGGEPVYENPPIKSRIAYIPDDFFYFAQASTIDMMHFYSGIYPNFDKDLFEKLREAFPIDPKKSIRRLSKGMQKQAAFWLAVSTRPEVMVLDEPVDGLDPVMRRQVWSILLGDVAKSGTTVLVSSHNLRELEDVCDHVGIIGKGHMMLEHSLSELQENIVKAQVAYQDEIPLPASLDIVNISETGRLKTVIVRGKADEISAILSATQPLYLDLVPLSLEEIFVYELGGADYAVKDIIL